MSARLEHIALGCGCFWCTEALLSRLPGVIKTEIGYGGGNHRDPTYTSVGANPDRHAELVRVFFDANVVSLESILDVFFKIHDPSKTYNINDRKGILYRSVICYDNDAQKNRILAFVNKVRPESASVVTTEIIPFQNFLKTAEKYQNYYARNPDKPFCRTYIEPKIRKLKQTLNSNE